jgi:hypothetical protein
MSEQKTHYRKVFKSDHLGVADLEEFLEEGKRLVFTIKEVKQEYDVTVAGRKGNHNIAYFNEPIKPLVLNSTNSKTVKAFCKGSSFVEDWSNVLIELYIDANVKMKGDIVGGVRIKPNQPTLKKPELTPENQNWDKAKEAVQTGTATVETIRKNWTITEANYRALCG